MPSTLKLKQAVTYFTRVSPVGMKKQEMIDLLTDQLKEMGREPENAKILSSILEEYKS